MDATKKLLRWLTCQPISHNEDNLSLNTKYIFQYISVQLFTGNLMH